MAMIEWIDEVSGAGDVGTPQEGDVGQFRFRFPDPSRTVWTWRIVWRCCSPVLVGEGKRFAVPGTTLRDNPMGPWQFTQTFNTREDIARNILRDFNPGCNAQMALQRFVSASQGYVTVETRACNRFFIPHNTIVDQLQGAPGTLGQYPPDCTKSDAFNQCRSGAGAAAGGFCDQPVAIGPEQTVPQWRAFNFPSRQTCITQKVMESCSGACTPCGFGTSGKECNSTDIIRAVQCRLGIEETGVWDQASQDALDATGDDYLTVATGCTGPVPTVPSGKPPGPPPPPQCPPGGCPTGTSCNTETGTCDPVAPTGARKRGGGAAIALLAAAALGAIYIAQTS